MRRLLLLALASLLFAPAAQPGNQGHAAWRWQRVITPNAAAPAAEQCAVLDAALFAGAAAGLRDVRLLQDGREIAYATDISLDETGGGHAGANADDRALYETVLSVPPKPAERAGASGSGDAALRGGTQSAWFYGEASLPAHVPVERIRLEPAPAGTEYLSLRAAEAGRLPDAESAEAALTPGHPALAFTIGANLQQPADIRLGVHGDAAAVSAFVLEMRRREICYQPLSASPVTLLFGNPAALPAHYGFGRDFQPKPTPRLSSMGPVQVNPAFRERPARRTGWPTRSKLLAAILGCSLALVLTLRLLLRNTS